MSSSIRFYEPLQEFNRLFEESVHNLNQRLEVVNQRIQDGNRANGTINRALRPIMDVHEDKDKNIVTTSFELPGLKKEDVQIELQNNRLTVSGESKISSDFDQNGFAVRERRFGKFTRTLQLPEGIKHEDIKASMENGVLTVTFPKTTPELAPKKIALL